MLNFEISTRVLVGKNLCFQIIVFEFGTDIRNPLSKNHKCISERLDKKVEVRKEICLKVLRQIQYLYKKSTLRINSDLMMDIWHPC